MRRMTKALVRFLAAEDGPTAVEYAAMLALVIVVCVGAITVVGSKTNSSYCNTSSHYPTGS